MTITFGGAYATADPVARCSGRATSPAETIPGLNIQTVSVGGTPVGDPQYIVSVPNQVAALNGNNARARVIIDGQNTGGATGFVLDGFPLAASRSDHLQLRCRR